MLHDPYSRQAVSKANANSTNKFRGSVQKQAIQLTREAARVMGDGEESKNNILIMIGKIKSYLELRLILMQDIGSDGYTSSLKGALRKLEKRIDALENKSD